MALVDAGMREGDVDLIEAPRVGDDAGGEARGLVGRRLAGGEIAEARLGEPQQFVLVDLAGRREDEPEGRYCSSSQRRSAATSIAAIVCSSPSTGRP